MSLYLLPESSICNLSRIAYPKYRHIAFFAYYLRLSSKYSSPSSALNCNAVSHIVLTLKFDYAETNSTGQNQFLPFTVCFDLVRVKEDYIYL